MRRIGGPLNAQTYALLAQQHRPSDPNAVAREILRLHRTGLTALDIATALRLDVAMVQTILHPLSAQTRPPC